VTAIAPLLLILGEFVALLGVRAWRIARLFELDCPGESPPVGSRRLIPASMDPEIADAMRHRGRPTPTGGNDA
jgi:hypothetical protein